jgi:hypothetical protein
VPSIVAAKVEAALLTRYPCAELPPGTLTVLGEEFGLSRERVRQIAKGIGLTSTPGVRRKRPRRVCASCGKTMESKATSALCLACRWITLICDNCQAPIRRLASTVVQRMASNERRLAAGLRLYSGRSFCNRHCRSEWGWKHYVPKAPRPPAHGTQRCYLLGCDDPVCIAVGKAMREAATARQRVRRAAARSLSA